MVFEEADGTFSSGRFASLGVAGGDDESVEGGEDSRCLFRLRELYVRWTLEDINFGAWCHGGF